MTQVETLPRAGTGEVAGAPAPAPLDDEAFERWAARHRENRIPLVPLDEVANYKAPTVLPAGSITPEAKLKS